MSKKIESNIDQVTYQPELDVTMYFMEMDECEDEENLEIDLDGGLSAINE